MRSALLSGGVALALWMSRGDALAARLGPPAPVEITITAFGLAAAPPGDVLDAIEAHIAAPDIVIAQAVPMSEISSDRQRAWAQAQIDGGADVVLWISRGDDRLWRLYGLRKGAAHADVRVLASDDAATTSERLDPTTVAIVANALVHALIGVTGPDLVGVSDDDAVEAQVSLEAAVADEANPPSRTRRLWAEVGAMYLGHGFSSGARWQSGLAAELRAYPVEAMSLAVSYAYVFPHQITVPERIDLRLHRRPLVIGLAGHWPARPNWRLFVEARAMYDRWRIDVIDHAPEVVLVDPSSRGTWSLGPALRSAWQVMPSFAVHVAAGVDVRLTQAQLRIGAGDGSQSVLEPYRVCGYLAVGLHVGVLSPR